MHRQSGMNQAAMRLQSGLDLSRQPVVIRFMIPVLQ